MARRLDGPVPGIAVFLAMTGAYLMFTGIKDVPMIEGLREFLRFGTTPKGTAGTSKAVLPAGLAGGVVGGETGAAGSGANVTGPAGSGVTLSGGTQLGRKIAETALKYLGAPYRWGGTTPSGWDCSGYVSYVLNEVGVSVGRMTSSQYHYWNGATDIPAAQCGAGDLVTRVGHVGIAVNATQYANAPTVGIPTRVQGIPKDMKIRRVIKGTSTTKGYFK